MMSVSVHMVSAALVIASMSSALGQPLQLKPPTLKDNASQICSTGRLDSAKLASWYYYNDPAVAKNFSSPDELRQAFRAANAEKGARGEIVKVIAENLQGMIAAPASGFVSNVSVDKFNAEYFLAGLAPTMAISCTPATAAVAPAPAAPAAGTGSGASAEATSSWVTKFRVRGTSDDLIAPRNSAAYTAASGATLSFSENGTNRTTSNALQATIGYDLLHRPKENADQHWPPNDTWLIDLIPFIAVERNVTDVGGKQSASSRENVMEGLLGSLSIPLSLPQAHVGANVFTATYEHLQNDIDNSQLNYMHFIEQPVINGLLNDYFFVPCCDAPVTETWFAASLLFDLRGDLGFYNNRGTKPSVNRNYQQIGPQFGVAISLSQLKSDVSITELYMGELDRSRNSISLFQAAWTLNPIPNSKDVGIKFSFQNGNIEATAQRIQQWLISLSAKY